MTFFKYHYLNQNHNHNHNHINTNRGLEKIQGFQSKRPKIMSRKHSFGGPLKVDASNVNHSFIHISTALGSFLGPREKGLLNYVKHSKKTECAFIKTILTLVTKGFYGCYR